MLRELRAGAQIQILNLKDFTISPAEVLQVTPPTPQFNVQLTPNGVMPPRQVLSMRIKWNGHEVTLNNLYADLTSSESNDGSGIVVCENDDAVTSQLRTAKANFTSLIENQAYFKKGEKWCDEQITMRDPVKQAEVQSARQVEAIKQEFNGLLSEQNTKIDALTNSLNTLLQALGEGTKK